tara:strand:+ start:803 stop:1216 length:414 start_codon:yes stop_codon:yes gene_type:complete
MQEFWEKLDKDVEKEDYTQVKILLQEIIERLIKFVPNLKKVHKEIRETLSGDINWDFQLTLVNWIEKFQAPIYDEYTKEWKTRIPCKVSKFLKEYYEYIQIVYEEVCGCRKMIKRGENIFKIKKLNSIDDINMKTGR